jgi:hypothetical protein
MENPLDPKQIVTVQELAISNMLEIEVLARSYPNLASIHLISITH